MLAIVAENIRLDIEAKYPRPAIFHVLVNIFVYQQVPNLLT